MKGMHWVTLAIGVAVALVGIGVWATQARGPALPGFVSAEKSGKSRGEEQLAVAHVGTAGLVDQDGNGFSLEGLEGRTVVVNFIFTRCPSVCPTQTKALTRVQQGLPAELRARVRFVSVTVDPEHDTPVILRRYAAAQGAELSSWSFVTGPSAATDALGRRFKAEVKALGGGQFDHRAAVHLLDAKGRLVQTYSGPSPDEKRLVQEIETVDRMFNQH
jgi:protein SCO1/2